jgi:thiamine kinase-like enzyme
MGIHTCRRPLSLVVVSSLDDRVMPIDFEFCGYNYRAFDLANTFSEWMYDYSYKEYPFYAREKKFFPTRDRQVRKRKRLRGLLGTQGDLPGRTCLMTCVV